MPRDNRFRHQNYRGGPPTAEWHLVERAQPSAIGAEQFARSMQLVADALHRAPVAAIYLVHGTFVGPDALGLLRETVLLSPGTAQQLQLVQKQILDALADDAGNFTRDYADALDQAINGGRKDRIPIRLFYWNSANHHIGRADGAIRLIDDLAARQFPEGSRVLFWGHSHGGNVLALVTNLLASAPASLRRFFRAARSYYRWPWSGRVDLNVWQRVRNLLRRKAHPLSAVALDVVTLGTPVLYGWDAGGYAKLLHFVHHRPQTGLPEYQAAFPPKIESVMRAEGGDYVQQLAIAGTNFAPPIWAWRAWLADRRLKRFLQSGLPGGSLRARLEHGVRVHHDGRTLLVDYGLPRQHIGQHLAGHAVYTRKDWLSFHAAEIARRFYDSCE